MAIGEALNSGRAGHQVAAREGGQEPINKQGGLVGKPMATRTIRRHRRGACLLECGDFSVAADGVTADEETEGEEQKAEPHL